MSELKSTIKECFEEGRPYYGFDSLVPKSELHKRALNAIEASLWAHQELYEADRIDKTIQFDDEHSNEVAKYISLPDKYNQPCYGAWDPLNPATDIGLRGLNPRFKDSANATTIVHADNQAVDDFYHRGAPEVVIECLDATSKLNKFIISQVVSPMLQQIAEAYGENPNTYRKIFLPEDTRIRTLTRVILYHQSAFNMPRLTGSDGAELLIKEHCDRSSFTIDGYQSGPGLEYFEDERWHKAGTKLTCFRGTADDFMFGAMKATLHRAVKTVQPESATTELLNSFGIQRASVPTFVSASGENVRVVTPNSSETHPTLFVA